METSRAPWHKFIYVSEIDNDCEVGTLFILVIIHFPRRFKLLADEDMSLENVIRFC